MRPPLIWVWVASQRWDTPGPLWQVSGAWKAYTGSPVVNGLLFCGRP